MSLRKKLLLNLFNSPLNLLQVANDTQVHVKYTLKTINALDLDGMLQVLDGISDKLCVITDSSECIRRLHPNQKWKQAAEEAFGSMSSFMNELNSDRRLAKQFTLSTNEYVCGNDLEKDAVIQSFKRDFDLFAVMSDKERISIIKLQEATELAAIEFEEMKTIESLEKMIKLRFELSKALGFKTPLELGLRDKQIKSFADVMTFLRTRWCTQSQGSMSRFTSTTMCKIVNSLVRISKDLFGVEIKVSPSRDFAGNLSFKFKIFDSVDSSRLLGTVLFELSAKDPNPTHYTIQCRKRGSSGLFLISACIKDFERVSFNQSQSIFHEFGHALHSVLSETKYQVLSGTRGPVDLAEVPSTFFELVHDSDEVQRELHGNSTISPVHTIRNEEVFQIQIAALDQLLHHHEPQGTFWSRDLAHKVEKEFALNRTRDWHCSLSHLATYGCTYFAYPFAKSVAERVYAGVKVNGGSLFKNEFLVKGGTARIDFLK